MRRVLKWLGGLVALAVVIGAIIFFGVLPAYVEDTSNNVIDHDGYPITEAAAALHKTLIVGDLHADPLLWSRDLTERGTRGQVDVPRLIDGNVALQVFTAVTKSPAGQNYDNNSSEAFDNITLLAIGQLWPLRTWGSLFERAIYQAEKLHEFEAKSDGRLKIIKTQADLEAVLAAKADGQDIVGGILGIEGAHPLEGDLSKIGPIFDAGHRVFGLHHFFDNELGGSLHGQGNQGLSDFGRAVVKELETRPVVVDLAHSSPQVAREVIEMTDMPLIVSHTGLHGFCPVKRNYPDDLMKAIAETGGVIGMGYWADVTCGDITPRGIAKMIKAAVDAVGEDHVSLGSDYDGSVETAFDTSELAALTSGLMAEGLTRAQIRKVMGENMVRVFRQRLQ
ncbi:Membrane dipeptidase (Peptidase family M19) [Falsiruegeria litorea R37]|uniref:Membrane dipeptidase (Peptidase family M19) n=1 Tax=Falsiruegeria litorea R37 TaxID=1200284 RepID=A0A1Y5ST93_9RHOB|nr:membrane dipeptidase [Falsiruegeria litorea]SLN47814.1 Membrane dipeptidase (Peptidase family M19) [Falsiruegeria litorea R37]